MMVITTEKQMGLMEFDRDFLVILPETEKYILNPKIATFNNFSLKIKHKCCINF